MHCLLKKHKTVFHIVHAVIKNNGNILQKDTLSIFLFSVPVVERVKKGKTQFFSLILPFFGFVTVGKKRE